MSELDWALIIGAAALRRRAEAEADEQIDRVVAELQRAKAAGVKINLSAVSSETGIARTTLLRRMA